MRVLAWNVVSPYQGAFERLERSDAKVSRAVLRGRGGVAAAPLPDRLWQ
jgi:hypothetical protein